MEPEAKTCQNCKTKFTIEPEDARFYKKIQVPPPTFCPECRLQRRFAWRNVRSLYKRKCDLCGKEKLGMYSPDKPFTVYCSPCWWSDKWDAMEYGREYDFSRPFFEQFYELMKEVPLLNRFVYESTMVRSDYTNMANDMKDCYLVFHGEFCERCTYCDDVSHTNDSVDVSFVHGSELCYDSFNLQKCSRVSFSVGSEACFDSYFLRDCVSCNNCFGCVNLRHKKYYIFNKPYSKEGYFAELKRLGFDSGSYKAVEKFKNQMREFQSQFPVEYIHARHNDNVSGDFILNSKNTFHSFNVHGLEDSKFCSFLTVPRVRDSYDWTVYGENGELMYEILQAGRNVYHNRFGWCIWIGTRDTEYGILNIDSSDCFGCIGVKKKKHCILNKQYSKDEFMKLEAHIVKHVTGMPYKDRRGRKYTYGEFFPSELSPFGYNETATQEEFPLDPAKARSQGYQWVDKEKHRGHYTITKKVSDLPDNIHDVDDAILNDIIACQECKLPYRIVPQELAFYRKLNLPLPRLCVECRYQERIAWRNQFMLYHRHCQCAGEKSDPSASSGFIYNNVSDHFHKETHCPNEFETSFSSKKKDIVYCEKCYLAEVA